MVAGPPALPGLDLHWSQHVNVTDRDGNTNSWHMLDTGEHTAMKGTIVAIHGNPTWSYMFRHVLADPPDGWRVIAVDQLNMGYSQRGASRRIGQRVDDLDDVINTLNIDGPLVLLAHDWGGAVALGWAVKNPQKVSGIILANTGIEQPPGGKAPAVIRAARTRAALMAVSVHTNNFIRGGLFLSRPAIPKNIRAGYYAPYSSLVSHLGVMGYLFHGCR